MKIFVARAQESGFVLVSCLWMLTVLTLAMGYIASQSAVMQDRVYEQTQLAQWRFERRATLSTFLYLGSTQRVSYAGLTTGSDPDNLLKDEFNPFSGDAFKVTGDELRLDDRSYRGIGSVIFSVQDGGSLIGLRSERQSTRLDQLLEEKGITRSQRRLLIAALKDYIDRDELESLDGIEARGYGRLGLLLPTNRFLVSPTQLSNVAGWSEALGGDLENLYEEVTVHSGNKYNFNTLTTAGMKNLDDFDALTIQRVLDHRLESYFRSLADVNEVAGVVISADDLVFSPIPDNFMRLRLWHPELNREERMGIRFTPTSAFAPWEIDYNVSHQRQTNVIAAGSHINYESNSEPDSAPAIFR